MRQPAKTILDVAELTDLLDKEYPQLLEMGERSYRIEAVEPMFGRMRLICSTRHLRPGGTISGPSMFTLADVALYITILANVGPKPLAVTTSVTINFLRKPEPRDLIADCRLLKLGKRLAFGSVVLRSDGIVAPVAHATGTYSIPPRP